MLRRKIPKFKSFSLTVRKSVHFYPLSANFYNNLNCIKEYAYHLNNKNKINISNTSLINYSYFKRKYDLNINILIFKKLNYLFFKTRFKRKIVSRKRKKYNKKTISCPGSRGDHLATHRCYT